MLCVQRQIKNKKTNIWLKIMPQQQQHPIQTFMSTNSASPEISGARKVNLQPRQALMGTHKKHGRNQEPQQKMW